VRQLRHDFIEAWKRDANGEPYRPLSFGQRVIWDDINLTPGFLSDRSVTADTLIASRIREALEKGHTVIVRKIL
jgi:hypothetical protein